MPVLRQVSLVDRLGVLRVVMILVYLDWLRHLVCLHALGQRGKLLLT